MKNETSILPCGSLNTKTGKTTNLGLVAINTYGESLNKVDNQDEFKHDQTGRSLFRASFIEAVPTTEFAKLAKFGKTVRLYCYK